MQQARVDVVALGEHFIELHRAENSTNVGHGQVDDRQFQVADFIRGFRRVDHLNEAHSINRDVGVIFGDDFLRGDIKHLFHHIDLTTNAVHERYNKA